MKRQVILYVSLLSAFLFATTKVSRASSCTFDGAVCEGEPAFGYESQDGNLVYGFVERVRPDGQIDLKTTDGKHLSFSRENTASTRPSACADPAQDYCAGVATERNIDGQKKAGTILAAFLSGNIVVIEDGPQPVSLKTTAFKKRDLDIAERNRELEALAKKFVALSPLLKMEPKLPCPAGEIGPKSGLKKAPKDRLAPDSLTRKSSFARFLLDGESNEEMSNALGMECTKFLRDIYSSGKTLYSQKAVEASRVIKDVKFVSGGDPTDFFHYTNKSAMLDQFHPEIADRRAAHQVSLEDGSYDHAFTWPKQHQGTTRMAKFPNIYEGVTYVAEDPESSWMFGQYRVTFHLDPHAKTISIGEAADGLPLFAEIESKFPGIWGVCARQAVRYFIAEDSGIDLILYRPESGPKWFQLIRPTAIDWVDLKY